MSFQDRLEAALQEANLGRRGLLRGIMGAAVAPQAALTSLAGAAAVGFLGKWAPFVDAYKKAGISDEKMLNAIGSASSEDDPDLPEGVTPEAVTGFIADKIVKDGLARVLTGTRNIPHGRSSETLAFINLPRLNAALGGKLNELLRDSLLQSDAKALVKDILKRTYLGDEGWDALGALKRVAPQAVPLSKDEISRAKRIWSYGPPHDDEIERALQVASKAGLGDDFAKDYMKKMREEWEEHRANASDEGPEPEMPEILKTDEERELARQARETEERREQEREQEREKEERQGQEQEKAEEAGKKDAEQARQQEMERHWRETQKAGPSMFRRPAGTVPTKPALEGRLRKALEI